METLFTPGTNSNIFATPTKDPMNWGSIELEDASILAGIDNLDGALEAMEVAELSIKKLEELEAIEGLDYTCPMALLAIETISANLGATTEGFMDSVRDGKVVDFLKQTANKVIEAIIGFFRRLFGLEAKVEEVLEEITDDKIDPKELKDFIKSGDQLKDDIAKAKALNTKQMNLRKELISAHNTLDDLEGKLKEAHENKTAQSKINLQVSTAKEEEAVKAQHARIAELAKGVIVHIEQGSKDYPERMMLNRLNGMNKNMNKAVSALRGLKNVTVKMYDARDSESFSTVARMMTEYGVNRTDTTWTLVTMKVYGNEKRVKRVDKKPTEVPFTDVDMDKVNKFASSNPQGDFTSLEKRLKEAGVVLGEGSRSKDTKGKSSHLGSKALRLLLVDFQVYGSTRSKLVKDLNTYRDASMKIGELLSEIKEVQKEYKM